MNHAENLFDPITDAITNTLLMHLSRRGGTIRIKKQRKKQKISSGKSN